MELAKTTLDKCKREIVVKYLGIQQFSLKHSDFVRLSEEIKSETGVLISVSTLRRFFDENYKGSPQMTTLDAFACYLGYKNWADYTKHENIIKKNIPRKKTIRINWSLAESRLRSNGSEIKKRYNNSIPGFRCCTANPVAKDQTMP